MTPREKEDTETSKLKYSMALGTLWRTAYGRDYGSLLKQITKWINTCHRTADLSSLVPRLNCEEFHLHSSKSSLRASSMKTNLHFSRKKRYRFLENLCNRNSSVQGGRERGKWGTWRNFCVSVFSHLAPDQRLPVVSQFQLIERYYSLSHPKLTSSWRVRVNV